MKPWEATVRQPGPGTAEIRVRIGAETADCCNSCTDQDQCLICRDRYRSNK